MKKRLFNSCAVLLAVMFVAAGCAPVISKNLREQVEKEISFKQVIRNPDAYQGKMVIWGGVIVAAKNTKEGTLLEILQKPTDAQGRPKDVDRSDGRFLALYDRYLDAAIYAQGREVTVAGEIKGKKILPMGEIQYTYPMILAKEIHLWPVRTRERIYMYPYPDWYYYRGGWYHPFLGSVKDVKKSGPESTEEPSKNVTKK
jgi:outer membrane lipoprotein